MLLLAYSCAPVKSTITQGCSTTNQALCQWGIVAVSPGPPSISVPSSITTSIYPDNVWRMRRLAYHRQGLSHVWIVKACTNIAIPSGQLLWCKTESTEGKFVCWIMFSFVTSNYSLVFAIKGRYLFSISNTLLGILSKVRHLFSISVHVLGIKMLIH